MTYYAVVDTNVVVSALLKEGSIPYQIIEFIRLNKIKPLYNEDVISEYVDVLVRNKFGFTKEQIKDINSGFNSRWCNYSGLSFFFPFL